MGKKIRYIRKRRDSYILYECMRITVFLVSGDSSKNWDTVVFDVKGILKVCLK